MPDAPGGPRRVRDSGWQQGFREAGPYLGLGMQLAMTMALFTIGGYFLDQWLETLPWLTIAGAVLGMVAIFVHIVRVSNELRRSDRAHAARRTGGMTEGEGIAGNASSAGASVPESSYASPYTGGPSGNADVTGPGVADRDVEEDVSALQRRFSEKGTIRDGVLLLQAWDALDMIEAARKAYTPVLLVRTYVLADSGARAVDTMDLSAGGPSRDSWYEATRFIDDLKDSGLYFEIQFGESI